jgi:hypothetical protein
LPLQWISFTAQKQNETVLLQWSTGSELNTSDFKIEHSKHGNNWTTIGNVLAQNAGGTNHYSYLHHSPETGINYYRIAQYDQNGKYSYSKIIIVDFNAGKPFQVLTNPIENKLLRLKINSSSSQTITITTSDGKSLWRRQVSPGVHSASLNILPQGIYIVCGYGYTEKIMVQ